MHTLPKLDYSYDALEPHISRQIMELHHSKHHQTYVDKLNAALERAPELQDMSIEELLRNLDAVPETIRSTVRNHGGGHYNHSLFWKMLSPAGGDEPDGELGSALTAKYGNFQAFQDEFAGKAIALFGSGWAWLMPDLSIITTPNQDNPIMNGQPAPILGLDVWEHAYYLDYTFKRAEYVKAWWGVVDWQHVSAHHDRGAL